jgi:hypothetical protein
LVEGVEDMAQGGGSIGRGSGLLISVELMEMDANLTRRCFSDNDVCDMVEQQ